MSNMNNTLEELKSEILKCNPAELLQIISIMGSLPQNKEKIPRLETLFKLITSLSKDEFQNNEFDASYLENILLKLSQIHSWDFIEDYEPVSVLDYPPVWILGKRYRVFPGPNDRAYEYWKQTIRYYFDIKEEFVEKYGYNPVSIIQQLLELQTKLVEVIEKNHLECEIINDLFVPTSQLITQWSEIIKKWKESIDLKFYNEQNIDFGELEIQNLIEPEPVDSIYKFFSVGDKQIPIFPHTFHGFLSTKLTNDHNEINSILQEKVIANSKYHLIKKLHLFFSKKEVIPEFSFQGTQRYDFAVFFDNNKLFLLKILHLDFMDDIESTCKNLFNDLKNMEKKIADGTTTFYYKDKEAGKLPHNNIEIIPIILFETTKVNTNFGIPSDEYINSKHMWFGFFMDFLSMLEEFDDFMRFLKYLRREEVFQDKTRILTFSNLDLFAHYLQNNDSFLVSGKIPHMISFMPGLWDKFKVEQIKKRPDFQARHEESEEDDFWDLKVVNDSLFHVRNQMFGMAANVFLLPSKKNIWILGMNENIQYSENEVHCISSLTGLIPHRFINNDIFDNLLQQLSIPPETTIRFSLMSTKMIEEQNIELMQSVLPLVTAEVPLTVKYFVTPESTLLFYIIYSPEHFLSLLTTDPLEGEKYVIKQILNEICNYANTGNTEEIVSTCLNELFQDALATFTFTQVPLQIATPTSGTDYPSTLQSDKSEITRMVAEFLTTLDVAPGVYEKEDAKNILNKTYEFLSAEFIKRMSNIEQTPLLSFLSHSEGQIIKDRILHQKRSRHESQFQMEHDPMERYSKKNEELNTLGEVYRYSIEIAMKHWSEGSSPFILEDWLELQAMAEQILLCSFLSSYLYFGLGEYQFRIFDDYSFSVETKNATALESFSTNFDKLFVSSEKPSSNYETKESVDKFIDDLNEPFKDEFKITFTNFFHVIEICLLYLNEKKREMVIVAVNDLFEFCKKHYPEISLEDMILGLDVFSLTNENMNHEFYPSEVRNRPFRHGCRPILKFPDNEHYLINAWSLDNVNHRIVGEIDQGYLLYNENFIGSQKLKTHLQQLRDKANKTHEKTIDELFKTKTNITELNLKKENQLLNNITEELPGEIDSLALFINKKEIFLVEAKNIKMSYAARDMSNEIKGFVESNGYIEKFNRKIDFVRRHMSEILDYYGISDKEGWKINSYFVTSNVSFPQEPSTDYRFITLTELRKIISDY